MIPHSQKNLSVRSHAPVRCRWRRGRLNQALAVFPRQREAKRNVGPFRMRSQQRGGRRGMQTRVRPGENCFSLGRIKNRSVSLVPYTRTPELLEWCKGCALLKGSWEALQRRLSPPWWTAALRPSTGSRGSSLRPTCCTNASSLTPDWFVSSFLVEGFEFFLSLPPPPPPPLLYRHCPLQALLCL